MSRLDISWVYCIVCDTWVELSSITFWLLKVLVIYSVSDILCRSADCDINVSQQIMCIRSTITTSMLITTSVCNLKYIGWIFHTAMHTLWSLWHGFNCCTTRTLRHRHRPLDVRKPAETQCGEDRAALDRYKTQSITIGWLWSMFASWIWSDAH